MGVVFFFAGIAVIASNFFQFNLITNLVKRIPYFSSDTMVYVFGGLLMVLGFIFFTSGKNRQVRCASCGWRGSLGRFTQSGGCPVCGSDSYSNV